MSQPANGDHIPRLSRQQLQAPIQPWHPPLALPSSRRQQQRKRQRSASPVMQQSSFGTEDAYVDPITGYPQEHFVKVLGTNHNENPRFAYQRATTSVRLENMDACCMPETLLLRTFGTAIREACVAVGGNVSRVSVSIESSVLRYPIGVPFRPLHQNTPQALLACFLKYEQSETIASLLGAPFTIAVSTIEARHGAGGRAKSEVHHNVNDSCLIEIRNEERLCLFYALEASRLYATVGKPGGMKKMDFSRMVQRVGQVEKNTKRGRPQAVLALKNYVDEILQATGIDPNLPCYSVEEHLPLVQQYYNQRWPGLYRIAAFTDFGVYKPVFKGEMAQYDVCVNRSVNDAGCMHFDGVRNLAKIFGKDNYCLDCEKPYYRKQKHTIDCIRRCSNCARMGPDFPCLPDDPAFFKKCDDCGKSFSNKSCFDEHRGSMCRLYHRCADCGEVYNTDRLKQLSPEGHKCEYKFCQFCFGYHKRDQECFIQPLKPAANDKDVRFVAFDFESTQYLETSPGKFQHRVNCVCAQVFCTKCITNDKWRKLGATNCEICGPERERSWLESDGINPLREFMDWLLGLHDKYRTYAFSHYGGRYDMILILKEIYRRQGLAPSVIQTGNKLYEIDVPLKKGIVARTTFRDSYNLMSRPLGDLVEAFQLGIEEKQFFPHLYNKACNYDASARRSELPPLDDYCPLGMKPDKYQKFVKWYEENRYTDFYLPEKLLEYCLSDVEILKHALVSFRREWIDITGDDVLRNATTIASACIRHFRLNHLEKESLVISPEFGYERHDNQSVIALKWLKWYAQENQVFVQHRDSQGGEKRIDYVCAEGTKRSIKLDGFVGGPQSLALEFYGCAWHGCPRCFPDGQTICPNGRTAEMNLADTRAREEIIRQQMDLKAIWECDVKAELKTKTKATEKMRKFFEDCPSYGPIDPRDAYFGARTGPMRLCFETEGRDDLEISYLDIQSLYPYTNYVTEYPLGKPDVTVLSQDVRWTHSRDNPYKGLLKVKVLPPWDLFLPVLPMKFDERLLFPLCRSCAIEYKDKSTMVADYSCTHSAEQRAFVTTTTHNELNAALDRGYIVTYVDRVWTWQTWSANLFKSYVAQFMKIKAEASGWPSDNMTDAEKQAYIDENRRRYGIELDASNMVKNPGRRHIAKLCLNSLWGRFSMRNNLTKSEIVESPAKFAQLVHDARFDVHSADMVSDTAAFVKYSSRDEFVEENASSNIFVSLWTTSAARLILYGHMEKVQTTPGCELLYTDTDSIIFVHPKGMNPVEKGQFLGQMGDECPKHHITAFYSGGAKQYALKKILKSDPMTVEYTLKVRGITLNEGTCRRLHFDSFKEQVLHYGNIDPLFVDTTQCELSKLGTVHTVHRHKRYRATCQKNIIDPTSYILYPLGYCF